LIQLIQSGYFGLNTATAAEGVGDARSAGFNFSGNYQNGSPKQLPLWLIPWVLGWLICSSRMTPTGGNGAKFTLEFGAGCWEVILVGETGWGVVPAYPIGRTFRDRLGSLVRRLE